MAKAGRPKKGSTKLPEWFDIERYKPVKDFGASEWYQQIAFRRVLLDRCDECDADVDAKNCKEFMEDYVGRAVHLLMENPIITEKRILKAAKADKWLKVEKGQIHQTDPFMEELLLAVSCYSSGLSDTTQGEVWRLYRDFPEKIKSALKRDTGVVGVFFDAKTGVADPEINMFLASDASLLEDWAIISVDLSLPEEALIKAFKAQLKDKKKGGKASRNRFLKNPHFSSWHKSGVLVYLDMQIAAKTSDFVFTWSALANALSEILDGPVGSESALAKTTQEHVQKLMDSHTLRALRSQAYLEQEGSLKKSGKFLVR